MSSVSAGSNQSFVSNSQITQNNFSHVSANATDLIDSSKPIMLEARDHISQLEGIFKEVKSNSAKPDEVRLKFIVGDPAKVCPYNNTKTGDIRLQVLGRYVISYTDETGKQKEEIREGWVKTTAFPAGHGPKGKNEAAAINAARAYGNSCAGVVDEKHDLHNKVKPYLEHIKAQGVSVKESKDIKSKIKVKFGDDRIKLAWNETSTRLTEGLSKKELKKLPKFEYVDSESHEKTSPPGTVPNATSPGGLVSGVNSNLKVGDVDEDEDEEELDTSSIKQTSTSESPTPTQQTERKEATPTPASPAQQPASSPAEETISELKQKFGANEAKEPEELEAKETPTPQTTPLAREELGSPAESHTPAPAPMEEPVKEQATVAQSDLSQPEREEGEGEVKEPATTQAKVEPQAGKTSLAEGESELDALLREINSGDLTGAPTAENSISEKPADERRGSLASSSRAQRLSQEYVEDLFKAAEELGSSGKAQSQPKAEIQAEVKTTDAKTSEKRSHLQRQSGQVFSKPKAPAMAETSHDADLNKLTEALEELRTGGNASKTTEEEQKPGSLAEQMQAQAKKLKPASQQPAQPKVASEGIVDNLANNVDKAMQERRLNLGMEGEGDVEDEDTEWTDTDTSEA